MRRVPAHGRVRVKREPIMHLIQAQWSLHEEPSTQRRPNGQCHQSVRIDSQDTTGRWISIRTAGMVGRIKDFSLRDFVIFRPQSHLLRHERSSQTPMVENVENMFREKTNALTLVTIYSSSKVETKTEPVLLTTVFAMNCGLQIHSTREMQKRLRV